MKTVVITGASRGIGQATAQHFLAQGWRVIGTYNKTSLAPELTAVRLDLSSPASIADAAKEIASLTSQVDVLVNNGAIILDAGTPDIDVEKLRKTFEVDVFGTADFTNHLLPLMGKGSYVINIDSGYGAFSFEIDENSSAAYRMAKAALNMYTRVLAFDLEPQGILVSSFDPGWVKTDMGNAYATEEEGPDREPSEVAPEIYHLATKVKETGKFWHMNQQRDW
jgi:NAD(P)-dependent dehydrogenase (short-subunit alcohol dehydrogenase family)